MRGKGKYNLRSAKSKAKPFGCYAALLLSSLRFWIFRPRFPKGNICILLFGVGLFFCSFQKHHVFCRSCYEEAVAFTESHKELTVFQTFCCFIETLDFYSFAVAVDNSLWIHKDCKRCISFDVSKLWKQAAFDYVITIKSSWHSFPRFTPNWIVVVVTDVCNVIQNCFVHKPLTKLSFFRFYFKLGGSKISVCQICYGCT